MPAGRKVSLEEAKVGSGTLPVRIQLTTPRGRHAESRKLPGTHNCLLARGGLRRLRVLQPVLANLLGANFVPQQARITQS